MQKSNGQNKNSEELNKPDKASQNAVQSEEKPNQKTHTKTRVFGLTRREVLRGAGGCAALLGLGGIGYFNLTYGKTLIRPPGGQDEDALLTKCIRCEKCYEACPRNVIVPAHIEDGIVDMRTPTLDFSNHSYCDYCSADNNGVPLCEKICPNDALNLPAGANKHNVIIGIAAIDTTTCLAYRQTACRTCYDNCPYNAITLAQNETARYPIPVVLPENCNGCGACESVCVSLTEGSIPEGADEVAIRVYPTDEIDENGELITS